MYYTIAEFTELEYFYIKQKNRFTNSALLFLCEGLTLEQIKRQHHKVKVSVVVYSVKLTLWSQPKL